MGQDTARIQISALLNPELCSFLPPNPFSTDLFSDKSSLSSGLSQPTVSKCLPSDLRRTFTSPPRPTPTLAGRATESADNLTIDAGDIPQQLCCFGETDHESYSDHTTRIVTPDPHFNIKDVGAVVSSGAGRDTSAIEPDPRFERTNNEMTPHVCGTCGKGFGSENALRRHRKTHGPVMPQARETCRTCGKSIQQRNFRRHLQLHGIGKPRSSTSNNHVHTEDSDHVCKVCGEGFTLRENLRNHLRVHTRERPHECETCGDRFARRSTLRVHELRHGGKSPHKCETCGKGFKRPNDLILHARVHTGERPHVCVSCGKAYGRSDSLTKHKRTAHPQMGASCGGVETNQDLQSNTTVG